MSKGAHQRRNGLISANRVTDQSGYAKAGIAGGTSRHAGHNVKVKDRVACPECGAALTVGCTSANGKPTAHTSRTRLATRLDNQERGL